MDTTVRATCPSCRTVLRIPSRWVGQAVKCKKCGAVVRSKPRDDTPTGLNAGTAVVPTEPAGNAFDFSRPAADDGFPLPEPVGPVADDRFDPTGGADVSSQPQPAPPAYPYPVPGAPPGYPYAVPPGYAPPGAYGPPPGYPYAPPPGYPYPLPPGYPPPGYAYPVPPGYPPPGVYAPPAGYPYAPAPPVPAAPTPPGPVPYPAPAPAADRPAAPSPSAPALGLRPADPIPSSTGLPADAPAVPSGRRYRRGGGKGKAVWVVVCLLLTGGLVAGGILGAKYLNEKYGKNKNPDAANTGGDGKADGTNAPVQGGPAAPKTGPFPRRMLFVHISRYMFLNPLTAAQPGGEDRTKPAATRLAHEWNVPYDPKDTERNQLFVLSDTARPDGKADAPMPMKNVVMGTYERFFETSRAQDRVVVYFGGHALEVNGKPYLAPIEGDLDDPEATLIPLADFYDKLRACKATQKAVVWDVCRFNPERGRQRPGSDPMPEGLHKALLAAPPGVEVVVTCGPGENALEFFNLQPEQGASATAVRYAGSSFLESMRHVFAKSVRQPGRQPTPADPIPVGEWAAAVGRRAAETAASPVVNLKQTVRADGKPPAAWVAFNPEEAPAKRFEFPAAPRGTSPTEVANLVAEFAVPPVKPDVFDTDLGALPFTDGVMREYKSEVTLDQVLRDKETYRFQAKTFEAIDTIRKMWAVTPGAAGGPQLRPDFKGPVNDRLKKEIKDEQDFWAVGVATLEVLNLDLDALAPLRDAQPRRWQAHYDYARAVLKARLAFMNEYNKLMGDVLTETLLPLDTKRGQDSYKLVSAEKMKSRKEVQQLAEEAREAYAKVVTDHKGTPWAIQAKREKSFALGLAWQPFSSEPAAGAP